MLAEDEDYLYFYQKLKFQENETNKFEIASLRRKCSAQSYMASLPIRDNEATCMILCDSLNSYSEVVDRRDENDVNNYAEPCLAMAVNCRNESRQWKCHLKDPEGMLLKLIKPFDCTSKESHNRNVCQNADPTDIEIKKLFERYNKSLNDEDNDTITSCTSTENKPVLNSFQNVATNSLQRNFGFCNGISKVNNASMDSSSNNSNTHEHKTFQRNTTGEQTGNFKKSRQSSSDSWLNSGYNFNSGRAHTSSSRQSLQAPNFECSNQVEANPVEKMSPNFFRTARDELSFQNQKKWGSRNNYNSSEYSYNNINQKKSLGARRGVTNKFIPPLRSNSEDYSRGQFGKRSSEDWEQEDGEIDERLKNIDPKMIELIRNEIMDIGNTVTWDDIAGLDYAKATIQEVVVWPILRPDIFTGLRRPPKGILLFGPPGTGKTLIGKCVASQSKSTFFSISASSLTSKWIGDGEKMVRALFAVARCHQPAVVFIDEIDSLLTQRSDTEHESSRRMKTEFLVQLDGASTGEEDRILVIGATNRPQELDEAARRRLVKKLYIPLPNRQARQQLVSRLMLTERNILSNEDIEEICTLTEGYSGADMKNLCQEAALCPVRSIGLMQIENITPDQVRPINLEDFKIALTRVRASVSEHDLDSYVTWDKKYGSGGVAVELS